MTRPSAFSDVRLSYQSEVRDAGIDVLVGSSLGCYGGTIVFPVSETRYPSITKNGQAQLLALM